MEKKTFTVVVNFSSVYVQVEAENEDEAQELALAQVNDDPSVYYDLDKEIAYVEELDADGKPIDFGEQTE